MTITLAEVTVGMSVGTNCVVTDVEVLPMGRRTVTVGDYFGTLSTITGDAHTKTINVNG